jgi:hypothetical protein
VKKIARLLVVASLAAAPAACRRAQQGAAPNAKPLVGAPSEPGPHKTPPPKFPVVRGPRPPRGKFLAIIYGGNGLGEIEPCG